jgi:hypothetical protein
MRYWIFWLQIVGPIRSIASDGRIVADEKRWAEWCPETTTADGW